MDFEPLNICDSEESTHGGPPGWLAISMIMSSVVLIAITAFIAGLLV